MKNYYSICLCRISALVLIAGFYCCSRHTKENPDLEPPDKRPVYHTIIGDGDEAEILRQELHIEPQNVMLPDLWFYAKDESALDKMKALGYSITKSELNQVYYKVMKSEPLTDEQIKEFKIQLLNREKDHFVIRGTLEQLNALKNKGIKLTALDYEPGPRGVKVIVSSPEDVQKASETGLDIYSTEIGKQNEIIIYGGAFDYTIDAMKKLNFDVSLIK